MTSRDGRQAHEFVFEGLPLAFETIYELRGFHPGLLNIEPFFRELEAPHRIAFAKIHYPPRTSTIQPEFVAGHTVDVACEGLDPGATVAWAMAGWESRQPLWPGQVDADGGCVIDGVPAGIRLIGRRRTPDVEPEAVGRSMR